MLNNNSFLELFYFPNDILLQLVYGAGIFLNVL